MRRAVDVAACALPLLTSGFLINTLTTPIRVRFDNLVLRALPVEEGLNVPRQVPGACFSRVNPTPLDNPRVVAVSDDALRLLDLDPSEVGGTEGIRASG